MSRRPATIAELAERALLGTQDLWNENNDFKHYLRVAEKCRRNGKEYAQKGDLENAFIEFAKAATFVLEKLPGHPGYHSILSPAQQHNLGLNGQDILDNLGELKPHLVDRYEKWTSRKSELADKSQMPHPQWPAVSPLVPYVENPTPIQAQFNSASFIKADTLPPLDRLLDRPLPAIPSEVITPTIKQIALPIPFSSELNPHNRLREGFWNRRGDHLTPSGFIVYAPPNLAYPAELRGYPAETEGYKNHSGHFIPYTERPELLDSLPRYGVPPAQPYESFIIYRAD